MNTPESPAPDLGYTRKKTKSQLSQRQRQIAIAAQEVAQQLDEPNIFSITRLIEIFGEHLVRDFANRARERFEAARAEGPAAYQVQPGGTDVATYTGAPRSCGGVFFHLMLTHAAAMGLDWFGLRISPPRNQQTPTSAPATTAQQATTTGSHAQTAQPRPVALVATTSSAVVPTGAKEPVQAQPMNEAPAKPNRIKATIIGTPLGAPKPTDHPGVLQLVFDAEMSPNMPKGLPTLGRSRVVVLCTERQYRQAQSDGSVSGRLIVEGEASTTLSTAGKSLLLIVCTRITTPDLEQAKRSSKT